MATYIALFRGINVGGKNTLSMKALARILEEHGYAGVKTYIQSGNVVFQCPHTKAKEFSRIIGEAITNSRGFQPEILLLRASELKTSVDANPFPEAEAEPKSLHLFFLADTPKHPDLEALHRLRVNSESFKLVGKVFYLHAPDGVGRSKLAMQSEKLIGVPATARNWNTVTKLLEMAQSSGMT